MATCRPIEANPARARQPGISGSGPVVPDVDPREVEDRVAAWTDDLRPIGAVQRYLVAQAARASVQLDRCRDFVESAREANLRSIDDHAQTDRDQAERLGDQLRDGDPAVVRQLRRSAAGCDWLLERWRWAEWGLGESDPWRRVRAIALAVSLRGLDADDPRAVALEETIRAAELTMPDDALDGATEDRLRRPIAARAELRRVIAEEVERLTIERAERAEREETERAEARRRAWFDPGPAGVLLRRYEAASESALFRSLNGLARLKKTAPTPPVEDRPDLGPTRTEATAAEPAAIPLPIRPPTSSEGSSEAARRSPRIVPFAHEVIEPEPSPIVTRWPVARDPDDLGSFALVVRSGSKRTARPSRR